MIQNRESRIWNRESMIKTRIENQMQRIDNWESRGEDRNRIRKKNRPLWAVFSLRVRGIHFSNTCIAESLPQKAWEKTSVMWTAQCGLHFLLGLGGFAFKFKHWEISSPKSLRENESHVDCPMWAAFSLRVRGVQFQIQALQNLSTKKLERKQTSIINPLVWLRCLSFKSKWH